MNLSDLSQSKYLKKDDVGEGVLATISGMTQDNVAKEGADPDIKAVLHFAELDKPLVLNKTNGEAIARITGIIDNIETAWVGTKVVLYNDPNVSFSGKITGGIRIRAPRKATQAPALSPAKPAAPIDDGLPF